MTRLGRAKAQFENMCTLLYIHAQLHRVIRKLCALFLMAIALLAVQKDGALSGDATGSSSIHCLVTMHYHVQGPQALQAGQYYS